jgi:hypothetical protein
MDRHNGRMLQRRNRLRFPLKPRSKLRIMQQGRRQNFHRYLPPKAGIIASKNSSHPTPTKLTFNLVTADFLHTHILTWEKQIRSQSLYSKANPAISRSPSRLFTCASRRTEITSRILSAPILMPQIQRTNGRKSLITAKKSAVLLSKNFKKHHPNG